MSDFVIKYKAVKGYTGTNNEVAIPDGVKKITVSIGCVMGK